MGYGFSGHIGIGRETTWGSGVAATAYCEALSEGLSSIFDRFEYKNIVGTMAESDDMTGANRVMGPIVLASHPQNIGHFLNSFFNGDTITVVGSSLFQHVFTQPTNSNSAFSTTCPTVPYTFEIFRDVTSSMQYTGCVVKELSFSIAANQDVRANVGLLGRGTTVIAKTAATFPNSPAKPFKFSQASISIAGVATTLIESLNIKMMNPCDGVPVPNLSDDIAKIVRTSPQTVELSGTLDFQNITEYMNFKNQTEQAFKISMIAPASFQMIFDMPKVVYTSFPVGIPGKDRLTIDFTAKAQYLPSSGTGIRVTLTSNQSYF